MEIGDRWLYDDIRAWCRGEGLASRETAFILYAMASERLSYNEAMRIYADWIGEAPERVHASLCYDVLRAGNDVGPETVLQSYLEERCFDDED